jgi:hypothetical protein
MPRDGQEAGEQDQPRGGDGKGTRNRGVRGQHGEVGGHPDKALVDTLARGCERREGGIAQKTDS